MAGDFLRVSRHGLTTVYTPPSAAGRAVAHVIFIHGLFGHPEMTWTSRKQAKNNTYESQHNTTASTSANSLNEDAASKKSGVFWPAEMFPAVIKNVNVHTWGYDADIDGFWSSASQNTVAQHATNLVCDLADLLESDESNSLPIFFVVHSLGGIVLKAAMNQSAETKTTRLGTVIDQVRGIIFLGTPHRGSRTASIGKYAYRITTIATRRPNLTLLQALERNSDSLDTISNSFLQTLARYKKIQIYSFREEKETRRYVIFNTIIVEADSAKIGLPDEEVNSIPENHSNMTKFSSPSDIGFKRVIAQLKRWVKLIEGETSNTMDDCLQSLKSTDTQLRFNTVTPSHAKTFHWLYDPNEVSFSKWLDRSEDMGSIYWIQGKPGSGKSTLMKFAMLDLRTRLSLELSDEAPYLIAGYFFHDRGKLIQKSIQGMLQSLLFSILSQNFNLLHFVQPFYSKLVSQQHTKYVVWDFDALQNAFQAIVQQRQVKTRLCLFMDALDEHHGDNDRLSNMMHNLVALADGDVVKIRLCLASRPWDTFVSSFGTCPGFKIHEHTIKDIEAYTSSQLHKALDNLPDSSPARGAKSVQLDAIANKISKRAQGVFIWVRIVVEQITAAIRDRTPFVILETMLMEMPSELEELYAHTLRRIDLKHAEESYVMLQIARCALIPLGLGSFANTASWELWQKVPNLGDETLEDLKQRVISRSGGLLEVIEAFSPSSSTQTRLGYIFEHSLEDQSQPPSSQYLKVHIVQFCHQTVKDYIQKSKGNFGLQRSNTGGNGYQYLLSAAVPSPRGWAKHMADKVLEYAVLSRKHDSPTSLHYIHETLTELFKDVNMHDWVQEVGIEFYAEQGFSSGRSGVICLMLAAGLLDSDEIVAYISPQVSNIPDDQTKDLWITALVGPRVASNNTSRKDMLQSLWDACKPVSANEFKLSIRVRHGDMYDLKPLELIVLSKALALGKEYDRLPIIEFLLSHGADPNTKWSEDAMMFLKRSASLPFDRYASETMFMDCIKFESASIIRLMGNYGARIPKRYCYAMRKMSKLITTGSDVFSEVMRIVELGEQESLRRNEADHANVDLQQHPLLDGSTTDDFQFSLILMSLFSGFVLSNESKPLPDTQPDIQLDIPPGFSRRDALRCWRKAFLIIRIIYVLKGLN